MIISIILMIVGTLFAAIGQILFKKSSKNIKNILFFIGIIFYGLSMVLNVIALKWAPLTIINPLTALCYIWGIILAMIFLKEKMNRWKWIGILCIIIGVLLIV